MAEPTGNRSYTSGTRRLSAGQEAFVFDAVRTPRGKGKQGGGLHSISPVHLLKVVLDALQQRAQLDTSHVDDVVLGCVTPLGEQGADIARTAVLYAGWAESVPGVTQSRFCASGLEAVNLAAMKVMSGQEQLVVAGGVESMSRVPMGSDGGAWYMDPRVNHAAGFVPQGIGADLIATLEGFSRRDVDEYAVQSHKRAAKAESEGYFRRSLVPVTDLNGQLVLARDELIRKDANVASLSSLQPSFATIGKLGFDATALRKYTTLESIEHVHHAGNSSGIVDGAALVLVGSQAMGEKLSLTPRARILSCAVVGSEPTIMLTGPTLAAEKALKRVGMVASDIDLWEINEAFAAVPMKTARDLKVDLDRVNVNGGAIALGHPLGATGAMLLGSVIDELHRQDKSTALVTLCVGGGMGIATIVERV